MSTQNFIYIGEDGAQYIAPIDISTTTQFITSVSSDFNVINGELSLYTPPKILSFSNDIGTVEIGTPVTTIIFNWTLNKDVASQSLSSGIGNIPPGISTYTLTNTNISPNTSFTLSINDGLNSISASTSILFLPRVFWGANASSQLSTSQIIGLSHSALASGFSLSTIYDCSGGQYPYYVYPVAFGLPNNVHVGGLSYSDWSYSVTQFTNTFGYTQPYYVLRFNGIQTGSNISVFWE